MFGPYPTKQEAKQARTRVRQKLPGYVSAHFFFFVEGDGDEWYLVPRRPEFDLLELLPDEPSAARSLI